MAGTSGFDGPSLIGATIDAYIVISLLGKGGMGEVYKARDIRLGRLVALKIVSELWGRDEEFAVRFDREARAASALSHPNVAQVYWAGRFEGRPYFAMEYVDGRSLAEVLRGDGRLAGRTGLSYLRQTCDGLRAALAKGIIHRDIKPANLMLDGAGQIKIVDFGLARRVAGDATLSRSDSVLGTPRYMSPEQALGRPVDHRSDIYSLGATFYHLFAGEPPFDAPTPLALMMQHVNEQLPSLKVRNPHVPAQVCALVHRMLAKRPEDRYQSYDDVLADLRRAEAGRVTAAPVVAQTTPVRVVPAPGAPVPTSSAPVRTAGAPMPPRFGLWLGLGALAILSVVLVPWGALSGGGGKRSVFDIALTAKTLANMRNLSTGIEVYRSQREGPPATLDEVLRWLEAPDTDRYDGWGRELVYRPTADGRYRLLSCGPDGVRGSEDDIVIENGRVVKGEPNFVPPGRRVPGPG